MHELINANHNDGVKQRRRFSSDVYGCAVESERKIRLNF